MASRWKTYREELNKINGDIEYYRSRGFDQVAGSLESRKADLERFLTSKRKPRAVHVAPVDEQESEDDFFEVDEEVDSTEENEEETQARQLTGSLDAEDFPVDESEEERQRDDPPLFDNETDENEARIGRDVRADDAVVLVPVHREFPASSACHGMQAPSEDARTAKEVLPRGGGRPNEPCRLLSNL